MNCGVRIRLHETPDALTRDVARLEALWGDGLSRFGGPFLAGAGFTAVDAFFAPVAFRAQTYGLQLGADAAAYVSRLLGLESMRRWYADGVAENFRDEPHEREISDMGRIIEDLRAR
jgi:glutathione S-transferase